MSEESSMEMMAKPAAEHERFKPFVGTFSSEVKLWMGPGDPMISTGVMTNTMDLDGLFLRQTYKGDPNPGPFPSFEGRGFWGYNTVTKQYEGFWVDNASSIMQTETGGVDSSGKVWTMVGEMPDPQTGQMMTRRSVITLQNQDHHKMEMFFSKQGEPESKAMEINYTRKK